MSLSLVQDITGYVVSSASAKYTPSSIEEAAEAYRLTAILVSVVTVLAGGARQVYYGKKLKKSYLYGDSDAEKLAFLLKLSQRYKLDSSESGKFEQKLYHLLEHMRKLLKVGSESELDFSELFVKHGRVKYRASDKLISAVALVLKDRFLVVQERKWKQNFVYRKTSKKVSAFYSGISRFALWARHADTKPTLPDYASVIPFFSMDGFADKVWTVIKSSSPEVAAHCERLNNTSIAAHSHDDEAGEISISQTGIVLRDQSAPGEETGLMQYQASSSC